MNHGHPLLSQVPLTSTLFPPRPVRLSYNFTPLPATIPQTQVTEDNLKAWVKECDHLKSCLYEYGSRETAEYKKWEESMLKLAPGYIDHGLLTPHKRTPSTATEAMDQQFQGLNMK